MKRVEQVKRESCERVVVLFFTEISSFFWNSYVKPFESHHLATERDSQPCEIQLCSFFCSPIILYDHCDAVDAIVEAIFKK